MIKIASTSVFLMQNSSNILKETNKLHAIKQNNYLSKKSYEPLHEATGAKNGAKMLFRLKMYLR